ncbi:hypothetical protein SAMD00019534_101530 [Acytostelium subglobosum LB1]|uniref:hypothetical protein n=1 Tax=Acytostelium subglobosum LB1 TaxID=1410327 RepID=UPI000644CDF0|nr:hypothetical protein SAMD00019534_101530 [Acytostelium subglobosum LB1]GAM26978.1 hypothetical protein SAMD00019534_101530 [Acytostelium subglobosum LB1]|eukprot:XP_012750246.1 hypothetical protein SAMD00019534_101530 [Acytostelium subglobosum LB1]
MLLNRCARDTLSLALTKCNVTASITSHLKIPSQHHHHRPQQQQQQQYINIIDGRLLFSREYSSSSSGRGRSSSSISNISTKTQSEMAPIPTKRKVDGLGTVPNTKSAYRRKVKRPPSIIKQLSAIKDLDTFIAECSKVLGINKLDDWYNASMHKFRRFGVDRFLGPYHGSIPLMLIELYPDHDWDIMMFRSYMTDRDFWSNPHNQRRCLEQILEAAGYDSDTPDNWHFIPVIHLKCYRTYATIVEYYDDDIITMLTSLYPDHEFDWDQMHPSIRFNRCRWHPSISPQFQLEMDRLMQQGINWYTINPDHPMFEDIVRLHGQCSNSRSIFEEIIYHLHELELKPWIFEYYNNWFRHSKNIKDYLIWLAENEDLTTAEDWYDAPLDLFEPRLVQSSRCIPTCIVDTFPQLSLDPTRFKHLTIKRSNYMKTLNLVNEFERINGITSLKDYSSLTTEQKTQLYNTCSYSSLIGALAAIHSFYQPSMELTTNVRAIYQEQQHLKKQRQQAQQIQQTQPEQQGQEQAQH